MVMARNFDDVNDWKYEVENGDTVLGFKEWLAHKTETDLCSHCGKAKTSAVHDVNLLLDGVDVYHSFQR
jgi:hypothetical protein